MNGGTFFKALLLLGLAAGASYMVMRNNIEKVRKELTEDQDVLKGFQRSLADRARELESVTSRTNANMEKVTEHELLTKKKAELSQTLAELNDLQKKTTDEFARLIQRVRSAGIGMEIPEMKLGTGAVLSHAKIEKVTETEMLVSHSGGVSRLSVKDIPAEYLARFRLGDPVMTGEAPVAAPSRPAPKTSLATPSASAPSTAASKTAAESQMYDLKTRVATLEAQIVAAEKQRDDYRREAMTMTSKHNMNRTSVTYVDAATGSVVSTTGGRIDTYNITAKENEKKASDLDSKITIARTQIAAMHVEIERLQAIVNR